ncbi:hypothetical protein JCM5353_007579 [Sporobolomyces roseus]
MARPSKKQRPSTSDQSEDSEGQATDYSDAEPSNKKNNKNKKKPTKKAVAKKGNKKGRKSKANDEDDEDEDEDEEMASDEDEEDGGKGGKKGELNETQKKEYIAAMTRYILFNETHRKVIKREDIVKNVLIDGRGRHFSTLMPKVQKLLKDLMGMELVLLRAKETSTGKSSPKAWLLRSTLPQPLLRHASTSTSPHYASQLPEGITYDPDLVVPGGKKSLREELGEWMIDEQGINSKKKKGRRNDDDEEEEEQEEDEEVEEGGVMRDAKREEGAAYGVLGTILALILVNGKVLGDDQLISYLRRLNLFPSTPIPLSLSSPHPTSLTLSAYLTKLTQQQYLERSKTAGANSNTQTQGGGGGAGRSQAPSRTQRATAEGVQESGDPAIEWRWGPRSEAELGEEGVARFVKFVFESGNEGARTGKRGKTGENLMSEVARAAGVKELQKAEKVEGGGFN